MKSILIIFFLLPTSSLTYSQTTSEAQIRGTIINFTEKTIQLGDTTLSVSDVGYKLGFTNLSHFSRVFKEHIGMKPKQYSRS